jgi:hypothetical protein
MDHGRQSSGGKRRVEKREWTGLTGFTGLNLKSLKSFFEILLIL